MVFLAWEKIDENRLIVVTVLEASFVGFYVGRQVICVSCENGIGRCWKPVMATKGLILTVLMFSWDPALVLADRRDRFGLRYLDKTSYMLHIPH